MEFVNDTQTEMVSLGPLDLTDFISWDDKNGAILQFTAGNYNKDLGDEMPLTGNLSGSVMKAWGKDNLLPNRREELLCASNIVPTLICTKRDITIGAGIFCYKEIYKDGQIIIEPTQMPPEVQEFIERLEEDDYFEDAAGELFKHANIFTEFIRNKGGKIHSLKSIPCKQVRAGVERRMGYIRDFFVCNSWEEGMANVKNKKVRIPGYMPGVKQSKFMYHVGDRLLKPDGTYYCPSYWSGKTWIELANSIPEFHKNNLLNSYSIKYHIQIPKSYFDQKNSISTSEKNREKAAEELKRAKQKLIDELNSFLAGVENTGRAFFSSYELNMAAGKEFPGIKIEPLKVDMQDEALLKLFDKSNSANISAQGVHPTLAAIETQGKLSSGSEIRNAFLMYVAIKAPNPRKSLLKPLKIVQKANGWPSDIQFGFRDIEITKLDEDPTGTQQIVIPNE